MWNVWNWQIYGDIVRIAVAWRKEQWGVTAVGHGVCFWGDENVLKFNSGDVVAQLRG